MSRIIEAGERLGHGEAPPSPPRRRPSALHLRAQLAHVAVHRFLATWQTRTPTTADVEELLRLLARAEKAWANAGEPGYASRARATARQVAKDIERAMGRRWRDGEGKP